MGLRVSSTLKKLDLSRNEIGDDSALEIAMAFKFGKLRLTSLNLSDNKIGNSGA